MDGPACAKCGEQPAGEGGVLCPACKQVLTARLRVYWTHDAHGASQAGQLGGEVTSSVP